MLHSVIQLLGIVFYPHCERYAIASIQQHIFADLSSAGTSYEQTRRYQEERVGVVAPNGNGIILN
ncbi:MAG TPA: hypothetical protein V6D11_24070 [Waterburya sp.]